MNVKWYDIQLVSVYSTHHYIFTPLNAAWLIISSKEGRLLGLICNIFETISTISGPICFFLDKDSQDLLLSILISLRSYLLMRFPSLSLNPHKLEIWLNIAWSLSYCKRCFLLRTVSASIIPRPQISALWLYLLILKTTSGVL